jgi:imidazole glycerol-phosphate synthase subunit HisH
VLDQLVLEREIPALGVCVGMQMLGRTSEEGKAAGLGWLPGSVRHLSARLDADSVATPHMGWNDVRPVASEPLFAGLDAARFYFLHSYYFESDQPDTVTAVSDYGGEFCCAVRSGQVCGVQFHPEKSHQWGTRLLQNFAMLPPC